MIMMEDKSPNTLTSAFLGDSAVFNAVASLLSKQQAISKEEAMSPNTSLLVLGNTQVTDTMDENKLLGSSPGIHHAKSNSSDVFIPSLEQVHALATANLLASTQRDIAQQLAEASLPKSASEMDKRQLNRSNQNIKKDAKCAKKIEDKDKNGISEFITSASEPEAFVCSFEGCKRKFAWSTHLKYHEMTHTNNRQFECPDENCRKTFFTAQRLKVHLRTHTGEKPFKCVHVDCGKTFTTAGNLKNHERIHTGEQPFICDFDGCNRRFTEYSSLYKHKLTHSGDRPFKCKVCSKQFTQSGTRRQHHNRHHLDEEIRNSLRNSRYKKQNNDKDEELSNSCQKGALENLSLNYHKVAVTNVTTVPCSPQVMVLSDAYHSHPTSESIIFSQGLNEHIVRVTSNSHHHHLTDGSSIPLSHALLGANGIQDESFEGKPNDDLVTLSQVPIYHQKDQTTDIVYTTDILDQAEVAHANFHVNTSASDDMVTNVKYNQVETTVQTDVSLHHSCEPLQPDIYQTPDDYIPHEVFQDPPGAYAEVKGEIPSPYLTTTDGEMLHGEFIGTKEVSISTSSGLTEVPEEDLAVDTSFLPVKESVTSLMDWDEHLHKH